MAYSPIANSLNDGLNNQPFVSPEDQARVFHANQEQKKNKFAGDLANKTDQGADGRNFDDISKIPTASQAETVAQSQGTSLKGLLNNVKQVPSKLKEAKKESDKYTGRLGMTKDGMSSIDINDPKARKEKFGVNSAGSMKSLMGDVFRKAKAEKKNGALGKVKDEAVAAGQNAISMATSELLQKSWLNAIDSWGLTVLFYINFHVFCRFVFGPKLFCKLGHEWTGGKSGGKTASVGQSASKGAGKSSVGSSAESLFGLPFAALGLAEGALLGLVDLIILFVVLLQLSFWVIIILIMSGSMDTIWDFLGTIWTFFTS
ncbi:MAG: hypothetical protein NTY12_04050 [Candidatus Falkowbacteria bacterium]|nr:hypothetical protein [Candidatus Falkowbacteria bacterium]